MNKVAKLLKESFIDGVKSASVDFEKQASYNIWIRNNPRFREKVAQNMAGLINKVRNGSSTKGYH